MNIARDERGGALIIVFFIVILMTVLAYSLASHTLQSVKQRAFSEDEVQGKLLADAGLAYFQEYLETQLKMPYSFLQGDAAIAGIRDSLALSNDELSRDKVVEMIRLVSSDEPNTYKEIRLPGMNGSFAIHAQIESRIPRVTGSTTQPYVLKLKVSVIGIPDRAENLRKVKLTSTVYVNTVPAPFHYAISTPGQLRLFGGSNVIGNVAADSVVTSQEYRYSAPSATGDDWSLDTSGPNYVEGEIYLPSHERLTKLEPSVIPKAEPVSTPFTGFPITGAMDLEQAFVPAPLGDVEGTSVTLSAEPETPHIPGYEPPLVTERSQPTDSLFIDDESTEEQENTATYVRDQISRAKDTAADDQIRQAKIDQSLWFKGTDDGQELDAETGNPGLVEAEAPSGETLVIESPYDKPNPGYLNLTARFTGNALGNIRQLYIGGIDREGEGIASVEMGRIGSFAQPPIEQGEPFTYSGTIFIRGNLDIVGDVSINGTIYVDGNVVIREIRNIPQSGKKNNLVIIASGKISLTDRYKDVEISNEGIHPLTAFLYSEHAMEIYSKGSHNRLIGGIATGKGSPDAPSYIELNSKREDRTQQYASHMSISFDRNIFDAATPGLPPGDRFHIDLYDKDYPDVGNPTIN